MRVESCLNARGSEDIFGKLNNFLGWIVFFKRRDATNSILKKINFLIHLCYLRNVSLLFFLLENTNKINYRNPHRPKK